MNLNQITPGVDYAYLPYRGRGEEFRWLRGDNSRWSNENSYNAKYMVYRVKAIRAYSEREAGNKRDTGYLDVFWLTDEGEFIYDESGSEIIKKCRVRDIATVWEDFEDERDYRQVLKDKEEREREERRRQQQEQWEREEAERRERRRLEQERIERERREREERERIERERIERERAAFIAKVEQHYHLPAGALQYGLGDENLLLDIAALNLDMDENARSVHLMKWSSSGQ